MAFPAALDSGATLPNPSTSSNTNNPSHAGLHAAENAAIIAVETKLGTGASTPASGTLLIGTGAGTSAWSALTSAQLASVLSDETGSGSAVFANTPTLITPKVDSIQEATLNNGVTVAGMNVKAGVITSPATAIGTNGVTAAMLATSAINLASVSSSTSQTSVSTSAVILTGLTSTVTIPAGSRKVRIEVLVPNMQSSSVSTWSVYIYNSATVTGSAVQSIKVLQSTAGASVSGYVFYEHSPAAGSQSYCAAISVDTGTGQTILSATQQAWLSVKVF